MIWTSNLSARQGRALHTLSWNHWGLELVSAILAVFLLLVSSPAWAEPVMDDWDAGERPPIDQLIDFPEGFQRHETTNFVFHYPRHGEARMKDLPALAEETLARISRDLGVDMPLAIHVFLVSNQHQWESMQPRKNRVPRWAAGLAYPKWELIYLRQSLGGHYIDVETTLKHEIAHLVFHNAIGKTEVPKWFHEGLAMYYAGEFGFERFRTLSYALALGRTYSLKDLDSTFPRAISDVHLAYAQSIAFVNFLATDFGPEAFQSLVRRLANREDFYTALSESFGQPLEELERSWYQDMKVRYAWIPALTSSGFIWGIASILFLWGYAKRRKQRAIRRAELELEDQQWEQVYAARQPAPPQRLERPGTQGLVLQRAKRFTADKPGSAPSSVRFHGIGWRLRRPSGKAGVHWIYTRSMSDWPERSDQSGDSDKDHKPTIH